MASRWRFPPRSIRCGRIRVNCYRPPNGFRFWPACWVRMPTRSSAVSASAPTANSSGSFAGFTRRLPTGLVSAQVVGMTNIDEVGQEGLELAYDSWLTGRTGMKRVIQDRLGRVVEDIELVREAQAGRELQLTLDRRLQYLAYRELVSTIAEHQARSGSVVVLDVNTGAILAMVNYPSFNPNARERDSTEGIRNRALTDVLEPGSVVKPFVVAAAMEAGLARPEMIIDTAPGYMTVSGHTIEDSATTANSP